MFSWLLAGVLVITGAVAAREVWVHIDRDNVPGVCHVQQ